MNVAYFTATGRMCGPGDDIGAEETYTRPTRSRFGHVSDGKMSVKKTKTSFAAKL